MVKQPIGEALPNWQARPFPPRTAINGNYCTIEPLSLSHAKDLFEANRQDMEGAGWTYMMQGPFADFSSFEKWVSGANESKDPLYFAILIKGKAVGVASYMRIEPLTGVIEIGGIYFSPALQKTIAATEAMYLFMRRAFDELGYRRYEWKCDSLNEKSRKAALRLGFTFEGIFRQATIYKGRNRDTAWFSIIDKEWPRLRHRFETWLNPDNFSPDGGQIRKLGECNPPSFEFP